MTNIQDRTCESENAPFKMNGVFSSVTPDMYNVESDRCRGLFYHHILYNFYFIKYDMYQRK